MHCADLIGNAQALKSVYATLIKGTRELRAPGYSWSDLRGKRPYRSWSRKLPNTAFTHMVILRGSERPLLAYLLKSRRDGPEEKRPPPGHRRALDPR